MMALGPCKGVQARAALKFQAHDGNVVAAVLRALILDESLIEYCALLVQRQVCHLKQHGAKAVFAKAAALVTAYLVDDTITDHIQTHAGLYIKGIFCKILNKIDVPVAYAYFVALALLHFALAEN